jgi:hypothetical protein
MYLSDGGGQEDHFAILAVEGIHAPVIVPVSRLQRVETGAPAEATPGRMGSSDAADGGRQVAMRWPTPDPQV